MKYKIGDKVKIIDDLQAGYDYGSESVLDDMLKCTSEATEYIYEACRFLGDDGEWHSPETILILYDNTNANNIRSMTDEQLARFLIGFKNKFGEEYEGEMSCLDWLRMEVEG